MRYQPDQELLLHFIRNAGMVTSANSSRRRSILPGPQLRKYRVYTRVIGSSVELHAEHPETGERYVSRADEFPTARGELLNLMRRCTERATPSARSPMRSAMLSPVAAVRQRVRRLLAAALALSSSARRPSPN